MEPTWAPRCPPPRGLVAPVPVDPAGACGPTSGQARGPGWRRSSPGLYVPADVPDTTEQRILEESRRLPEGGAVGGWAALRLHGGGYFDGLAPDGRTWLRVPLVLPPGGNLRPGDRARLVREPIVPDTISIRHGVPCLSAARAAVDEARWAVHMRAAVVVFDMALVARLVTRSDLQHEVGRQAGSPGIRQARAALDLAEERSLSPQETFLRLVWVLDAGLPRPQCNWHVFTDDHRFVGMPDLLSQEFAVVGEYDGAAHAGSARRSRDARRSEAFRDLGLEHFTVVADDRDDVPALVRKMRSAVARAAASAHPRRWLVKTPPPPLRID